MDTGLPSTKFLQNLLRNKQPLELKLVTGDTLNGVLRWQDEHYICVEVGGQAMMIPKPAIAYLKGL